MNITEFYDHSQLLTQLITALQPTEARVHLQGATGSLPSVAAATLALHYPNRRFLLVTPERESAYYLLNDTERLLGELDFELERKRVLLFPASLRKPYDDAEETTSNANVMQRSEVVRQLAAGRPMVIVSYADALSEKVMSQRTLTRHTLMVVRGTELEFDYLIEVLQDYGFDRVDFVVEPGQFSVRGGIIDVFSYGDEHPYRISFFGDKIDSLRTFDPVSQLSIKQYEQLSIIPNLNQVHTQHDEKEERVNIAHYFSADDIVFVEGLMQAAEKMEKTVALARERYAALSGPIQHATPDALYSGGNEFLKEVMKCRVVELGSTLFFNKAHTVTVNSEPQPVFNKQFDLMMNTLRNYLERGYQCMICTSSDAQSKRLMRVFEAQDQKSTTGPSPTSQLLKSALIPIPLHHGFIDHDQRLLCFTDHEIFERYQKYTVRDMHNAHEALTLKELMELKPGDYITHIDYGVGRFAGLERIESNGHQQEVIRLVYKNNDILYLSIHSLHKISRYVGREGEAPTLNKLGSNTWQLLKQRTKKQVKDIAKDLIALYAKRKATRGFAFSADSYLQNELEASFMYEDTPDQLKATHDVKNDMESSAPMDRLVCGDVGFGKTEVAIRAAFKAVCDSKQVAVLVPSTILAFQHYNTFRDRLAGMPVNIEYLNRLRTTKKRNDILKRLASGQIDIIIGTHAITNPKIQFHDLGLLIIDEEQKFGVATKERLRQMKVNVDCLTLTATPIPRTLQFSLMGARDLSVIQTPPPNRQPIHTEVTLFDEETIRDAISRELNRGGQVFFVNNRIETLDDMAGLIKRLVPDATVVSAHGQMNGKQSEEILMRFVEGDIDVLVATSIVENGLDIPNANTMIINNAQYFGLSDLHQMRGRVGRSNRKAYCYMLVPSFSSLTDDAQKRLKAIAEFSSVGSGFNLAMRDLDIRGAGNILGAEQSGFISEIGYDMYHKILNEAIEELKETDFRELFRNEREQQQSFVPECVLETDLEVLIPDDYVSNVSERLLLYRELNGLTTTEELEQYKSRLIDRFGPIPQPTQELIKTIILRQMGKEFGIERLVLKQDRMVCFFSSNLDNAFYRSANFNKTLKYASLHSRTSHLRDAEGKCSLTCDNVGSIQAAIATMNDLIHGQ